VLVVPMGVSRYGEHFIKRTDPRGRTYYWATNDPPAQPEGHETDLTALAKGFITVTPLGYNMTRQAMLEEMQTWTLKAE
jgi:5'-nucleotidase